MPGFFRSSSAPRALLSRLRLPSGKCALAAPPARRWSTKTIPPPRPTWPRYATALLSAPVFGLSFWLFGFVIASLAAMLLMPALMGYPNRRLLVVMRC